MIHIPIPSDFQDDPSSVDQATILKYLKIVPVVIDQYSNNCPYYAGPVVFAVTSMNLLNSDAANKINGLLHFLLVQPS